MEEEESKLGVGEKKTTTAWLAWLTDIFLFDPFFAFSLQRFKKPWRGLFSDLTVPLKGYLTAVIHDSQNDGDK